MELLGLDVVKYLNGYDTVRDGMLVGMSIHQMVTEPVIELTFEVPHEAGLRVVKLELRDIQEFVYSYTIDNPQYEIGHVKCVMTDAGDFFLSLDPYDEREQFVSEKDNDFFRSKLVKLTENRADGR